MYNSLRLLFAFDKSRRHFAVDNVLTFFCCGEKAFLQGVFEKTGVFDVVFCGEVVVIRW
jgi:hypothetical protein